MPSLFRNHRTYFLIATVLIASAVFLIFSVLNMEQEERVSATVELGEVRQSVAVSGVLEAEDLVSLGFQTGGIIKEIYVTEGSAVEKNATLAELEQNTLSADRAEALASIRKAQAERAELIAGISDESKQSFEQTILLKQQALASTKKIEAQKVKNAYKNLLSSGLNVYSNDADEDAVAPTISGTYSCEKEGTYELVMYSSNADSGYSFRLSGIEEGTYTASTNQAIAFGSCGLRMLFDSDSLYSSATWYIDIPNTKSASYTANKNTYELALVQEKNSVSLAEQELKVTESESITANAPARAEAIAKANATIAQAEARLARLSISEDNNLLKAPFAGTITNVEASAGEVVGTSPIITLLAQSGFKLIARIPEIDIANIEPNQKAEVRFDARADIITPATVNFISPNGTDIGGVTYFEVHLTLDEDPPWLRSGLNADLDIIINEEKETLRVPRRFVIENEGVYTVVLLQADQSTASTTIDIILTGNDGYMAITGLNKGDIVVAP